MLRGILRLGVATSLLFTALNAAAHDTSEILTPGSQTGTLFDACEAGLMAKKPVGGWDKKIVILDTNIIFNDPNSIYRFPGAQIIIPGAVMTEVGRHKSDDKLGRAARQFIRTLRTFIDNGANTKIGVNLGNNSILKVDSSDYTSLLANTTYDKEEMDNRILATAMHYRNISTGVMTYLITDDGELMIKANGEDVPTMGLDYQFRAAREAADENALPSDYLTHKLDQGTLNRFKNEGKIAVPADLKIRANQFVMFSSDSTEGSVSTLGRFFYDRENPANSGIRKIMDFSKFPVQPKNLQQAMLLDVLLDPSIHLVISQSAAGTGKTFLAIVAGLLQMTKYDKMLVTRTLVQIGKTELGAMPGTMDEKLKHWMPNIDDAFEALTKALKEQKEMERAERGVAFANGDRPGSASARSMEDRERRQRNKEWKRAKREAQLRGQPEPPHPSQAVSADTSIRPDRNRVESVPFPHIRGRSIGGAYLILDEAQNTSLHEMKTFLTRAGEGTKMIILGDASQIDSPFLNERNNGLTVASNLFASPDLNDADSSLVAQIRLTEGVRSELADLARRLFEKLLEQPN